MTGTPAAAVDKTAVSGGARRATSMPPEKRRAAIVRAVRPLLIEHGPALTIRQIAAAAEVAEGTIFGVFADKDELIAAVVADVIDVESFELAVAGIDRNAPFEQRLVSLTELIQARVVDVWQLLSSLGSNIASGILGVCRRARRWLNCWRLSPSGSGSIRPPQPACSEV